MGLLPGTSWSCTWDDWRSTDSARISCLNGKVWHDSPYSLKQVDKIGRAFSKTLFEAGVASLPDLAKSDGRRIEFLLSRHAPFGNTVIGEVMRRVPMFACTVERCLADALKIELRLEERTRREMQRKDQTYLHILVTRQVPGAAQVVYHQRQRYVVSIAHIKLCSVESLAVGGKAEKTIRNVRGVGEVCVSVIAESWSGLNQHIVLEAQEPLRDRHEPSTAVGEIEFTLPSSDLYELDISGENTEQQLQDIFVDAIQGQRAPSTPAINPTAHPTTQPSSALRKPATAHLPSVSLNGSSSAVVNFQVCAPEERVLHQRPPLSTVGDETPIRASSKGKPSRVPLTPPPSAKALGTAAKRPCRHLCQSKRTYR